MQDILYLSGIQHHALRTNRPQNVRAESLRKQMAQLFCLKSIVGQLCLGGFLKLRHPQIIQIGAFYSIKTHGFVDPPF